MRYSLLTPIPFCGHFGFHSTWVQATLDDNTKRTALTDAIKKFQSALTEVQNTATRAQQQVGFFFLQGGSPCAEMPDNCAGHFACMVSCCQMLVLRRKDQRGCPITNVFMQIDATEAILTTLRLRRDKAASDMLGYSESFQAAIQKAKMKEAKKYPLEFLGNVSCWLTSRGSAKYQPCMWARQHRASNH